MVNSTLPYRAQQARGMSRFCFQKGVMIGCAEMLCVLYITRCFERTEVMETVSC